MMLQAARILGAAAVLATGAVHPQRAQASVANRHRWEGICGRCVLIP